MNAKELNRNLICPRCLGLIPNAEFAGMYPGALSRTDNKTEICSDCGNMEAIEDFTELTNSGEIENIWGRYFGRYK